MAPELPRIHCGLWLPHDHGTSARKADHAARRGARVVGGADDLPASGGTRAAHRCLARHHLAGAAAAKVVTCDQPFHHGFSAEEMLLEDALEALAGHRAVPRAV